MPHFLEESFRLILQMAAMLSVAHFFGKLARHFSIPSVVGEILGGIVLGPTIFGLFLPSHYQALFPGEIGSLPSVISMGVKISMLIFLFVAGLEVDLAHVQEKKSAAFWSSTLGIALPFALGFLAVIWFPKIWTAHLRTENWVFAFFMGTALAISALPVIVRILMEFRLLNTPLGAIVITSAMIDDLIGWTLFAIILGYVQSGEWTLSHFIIAIFSAAALLAIIFGLIRWIVQKLFESSILRSWALQLFAVILFMVIAAACAEGLGLHASFGAFLAGVALGQTVGQWKKVSEWLNQSMRLFFAPFYFVSLGLKANFAVHFEPTLVLIVLVIAFAGKIIGVTLGSLFGALSLREALSVGFAMNARGAMEMILASIALENHLISEPVFVALIGMAIVTSITSGPVIGSLLKIKTSPQ